MPLTDLLAFYLKQADFFNFDCDDGCCLRYARWAADTDTQRGTAVILPGRTEFIEKYAEVAGDLLDRGFDVFVLDWRGQGLSCRELKNPHKGYVASFERYVADLHRWLADCVSKDCRGPLYLLAHSMGGNVALHFASRQWDDLDLPIHGLVLTAPMVGLRTDPYPVLAAEMICRWWVGVGQGESYAMGNADYHPFPVFENNDLTSDPVRFGYLHGAVEAQPALALGGVTYRWLAEAFTSMRRLMAKGVPERIGLPVLLVAGGRDTVVSNHQLSVFASRLAHGRYAVIRGARHEILMEQDHFRNLFWEMFDDFIAMTAA